MMLVFACLVFGCAHTEHFWDTHIDPLGYEDQHDRAMSDAVAESKRQDDWFGQDWLGQDWFAPSAAKATHDDPDPPIAHPTHRSKPKPAITDANPSAITNFTLFGIDPQPVTRNATNQPVPVTFPKRGSDFDPVIDPTGRWLVFASTRDCERPDLFLKAVDGTDTTRLTEHPASDLMPAFSPDGRVVVFASDRLGPWDLYLLNLKTGHISALTQSDTDELHPTFAPDGKRLVFCSRRSSTEPWHLILIDLESPMTWHLLGKGLFPQWSPDGRTLVYQRPSRHDPTRFEIWMMDLENNTAQSPRAVAAGENASLIHPCFSPDGGYVAFVAMMNQQPDESTSAVAGTVNPHGRSSASQVWTMNREGGERQRLSDGRAMDVHPCWSKTGALFVASNRAEQPSGGSERIWRLSP